MRNSDRHAGRRSRPVPQELVTHLGAQVRAMREHAGLSREDLAAAVGTSYRHLVGIELGERVPAWGLLSAIAEVCKVEVALEWWSD